MEVLVVRTDKSQWFEALHKFGPVPAAVIGALSALIDSRIRRVPWTGLFTNVVTYATYSLIGAVLVDVGTRYVAPRPEDALQFGAVVLVAFLLTNVVNFVLVLTVILVYLRVVRPMRED